MRLEYVISGCGYTAFHDSKMNDELAEISKSFFRTNQHPDYDFSVLFNAWVEPKFLAGLQKAWVFHRSFSDSGGLQVVTLGKEITPELRRQVYNIQSESDVAMCFDEIPLIAAGGSKIGDTSNRVFDATRINDSAIGTANNINEQANMFDNLNTHTKIMAIAHGNEHGDYVQYTETLFKHLTEAAKKRIAGISMAGTCNGSGLADVLEPIQGLVEMQIPPEFKKNVHLLGFGSMTRILPFMILENNILSFVDRLSFDSTTHSSAFSKGRFLLPGEWKFSGKSPRNALSDRMLRFLEIVEKRYFNDHFTEEQKKKFHLTVVNNLSNIRGQKHDDHVGDMIYLLAVIGAVESSRNFMEKMVEVQKKPTSILQELPSRQASAYRMLMGVKTLEDYIERKPTMIKLLGSKKIRRVEANLTDLFE